MNVWTKSVLFAVASIGGIAAAALLFFVDPARVPIYPVCQFHQLTGLDCPGCGGLRAMHELLHGHFITALHFNPVLVLSVPLGIFLAVRLLWREITCQPGLGIRSSWLWIYLGIWIAFGILRNLPLQPFTPFAP